METSAAIPSKHHESSTLSVYPDACRLSTGVIDIGQCRILMIHIGQDIMER